MITPYNPVHRAYELHQQGLSLEQVADRLNTNDDRASQLIAYYERERHTKPTKPWWDGLSNSTRIYLQEQGMHNRASVKQAYCDGLFTRGYPNYLSGMTAHRRKCIIEWLNRPDKPEDAAAVTYPIDETITLRLPAECVRTLESLSSAARIEPDELVERWIDQEAIRKGLTWDKK